MILTHGANSLNRGGTEDTTGWDIANIPTGYIITNEGITAIPFDSCGINNNDIYVEKKANTNSCGVYNDVVSVEII